MYGNSLRYTMYVALATALLAARPLIVWDAKPHLRRGWVALLLVCVCWNVYSAVKQDQPFLSGYRAAADFVSNLPDQGISLFCCKHDGNYIFHMRRLDQDRQRVVLRADKVMVSLAVNKYRGVYSHMQTEQDLYSLLDKYGVSTIVVESRDLVDLPEFEMLLKAVEGSRFELLAEYPLETNLPGFADIDIQIYRYLDAQPLTAKELVIPMPHLGRELRLPL